MTTARERIYGLFLTHPKDAWTQKDLAARAACSRGYVSRVVDDLTAGGVLGRPYKNRVVLAGPAKLLTLWASRRSLPRPVYVASSLRLEDAEALIGRTQGTALTLFRAAWHRTKFMATSTLEAYALPDGLPGLVARLGSASPEPTSILLYPAEGAEFEAANVVDELPLVSVPQNVVDLIALGGQGPRVALHLARAHGLWEA